VNVATFVDVIGDYLLVCIQLDHTDRFWFLGG
jgi:hypothetical protein